MYVSKCCKAKVKTEGTPDFIGDTQACTCYAVCTKCGEVCDTITVPDKSTSYTSVEEVIKSLHARRKWYDYPRLWFYWYFWNYVSKIPLEIKSFIQRGIRGYSDRDTWNFDVYLTDVIEGGIKRLVKYNIRDDKEYIPDLKIIVKTMELSRDINENPCKYTGKENWKKSEKEFKQGMKILAKRWFQLWD